MDTFDGKIAIVTGGASGIGRALVEELTRRGASVTAVDNNSGLLDEVVASIADSGGVARAEPVDVTDFEAVKALIGRSVEKHGRLDYIFNNAGVAVFALAEDHSYEDWCRVLDVNLFGAINGVIAAYPVMIQQGSGHIINTASVAGLCPSVAEVAYTTSKYGIVGLSNTLRIEAARHGVKVSVVCPSVVDTPILRSSKMVGFDNERLLELERKWFVEYTPTKATNVILRGVKRNRATIPVRPVAHLLWRLNRFSPALYALVSKRYLKEIEKARI